MKLKTFGVVSLLVLAVALLWIVLLIVSISIRGPVESLEQAIQSLSNPGLIFYMTYVNAALITILDTVLFVGLYMYCKDSGPVVALIGLIFVPVYCALNLFSYLSQITMVPALVSAYAQPEYQAASFLLLGQMIQDWQGSLVSVLNNLAYAILGISSIAFGRLLLKGGKYAWISGILLILNAIACIVGVIGVFAGNTLVSSGSVVGGVLFIVALGFLTVMFFTEPKPASA